MILLKFVLRTERVISWTGIDTPQLCWGYREKSQQERVHRMKKHPLAMNHLFDSILLELILYLPLDPKNGRKLLWNGSQEIDASLPLRP